MTWWEIALWSLGTAVLVEVVIPIGVIIYFAFRDYSGNKR